MYTSPLPSACKWDGSSSRAWERLILIIMAPKLTKKHHHHVQHDLYQVASPKSLDAGADINAILQFSDSDEAIYDCFINPKYKVLTKTF